MTAENNLFLFVRAFFFFFFVFTPRSFHSFTHSLSLDLSAPEYRGGVRGSHIASNLNIYTASRAARRCGILSEKNKNKKTTTTTTTRRRRKNNELSRARRVFPIASAAFLSLLFPSDNTAVRYCVSGTWRPNGIRTIAFIDDYCVISRWYDTADSYIMEFTRHAKNRVKDRLWVRLSSLPFPSLPPPQSHDDLLLTDGHTRDDRIFQFLTPGLKSPGPNTCR